MLRILSLLGLALVALALPLALLFGDQSSTGPLVLVIVGGTGLGLAGLGLLGLAALWRAGDPEGHALTGVFRWMAGLGLGLLLDLLLLLRDTPAAFAAGSGWLTLEIFLGGAVALTGIGAVGAIGTSRRTVASGGGHSR